MRVYYDKNISQYNLEVRKKGVHSLGMKQILPEFFLDKFNLSISFVRLYYYILSLSEYK